MLTAYRIYPLLALTAIAGASVWLDRITRVEDTVVSREVQSAPDFIATETRIVGYAQDGSQRYELLAERLEHLPIDDTSRFFAPRLTIFRPGTKVHITAQYGTSTPGGEQIDLSGEVRAKRTRSADAAEFTLNSEALTVWPDPQRARTDKPVVLTQGATVANALGMETDNLFGTLDLIGQVKVLMPRSKDRPS